MAHKKDDELAMKVETPDTTHKGQNGLKLQVASVDDISVLSALFQDALIRRDNIHYDKDAGEVVIIADRYCWEIQGEPAQRVLCGLRIGYVKQLQQQQMNDDGADSVFYNLLNIAYAEAGNDTGHLIMHFSAGAAMRLTINKIAMVAGDVAPPRPAAMTPDHEAEI